MFCKLYAKFPFGLICVGGKRNLGVIFDLLVVEYGRFLDCSAL